MSITVLDPGPLTTVQDAGRVGYAAQGYRSCGAADGYAYRLGNVLVGNDPGAAVLECTLRGAALRFETDTVFALTGAESPAALDSTPVPYYAPLLAKAGSVLQMGAAKTGLRSYLAVGGGIATPPVLGSRATDVKCGIGGLEGRKLAAGDTLPIGSCDTPALWQAITAKRLELACRLLITTNDNISVIAQNSGFENPMYFASIFKAHYGMTPTKFRESAV